MKPSKKSDKKFGLLDVVKNNAIDAIVAGVCVVIFLYLAFGADEELRGSIFYNIFNVFVTFIFTWITAKISCIYQYEKENRKYATTAYRHNRNLITKIDYNIDVINNVIVNRTQCKSSNQSCQNKENLFRLRDSLIAFKEDAQENLGDWTNLIASDISQMTETRKRYDNYKATQRMLQDENTDVEESDIEQARKTYEKAYDSLSAEFKIIFDNEIKIADEMQEYVEQEKKMQAKEYSTDTYRLMGDFFVEQRKGDSVEEA